jgi:hypothetical protein
MEDPAIFPLFLAPVFRRGKGLINLLARKVNSDDPKIEKKERAKPYRIRDRRCLNLSSFVCFGHLRESFRSRTAEDDY